MRKTITHTAVDNKRYWRKSDFKPDTRVYGWCVVFVLAAMAAIIIIGIVTN